MMRGKGSKIPGEIVVVNRTRQRLSLALFARIARTAAVVLGARNAEVGIVFVGETEMRRLALRRHRSRKTPNVLSFSYRLERGRLGTRRDILGDIVVCPSVSRREARGFRRTQESHLAALLVHGMVHLAGYRHYGKSDAQRMERLEQRIARQAGILAGNPKP